MQQKECMIVRDLLDSYMEDLTGDNTKVFIEKHLKECSKCKDIFHDLLEEQEEQKAIKSGIDKRLFYKLKRYRYQLLGVFLGFILTIVLIFGLVFYVIFANKARNNTEVFTNHIEDYGVLEEYYGYSGLKLFPDKNLMEDSGEILEYVYDCSGTKLHQTCQIYLECEYTVEEFDREKARLQQIKDVETDLSVIYSSDDYEYPAIYAMKNVELCNEYALLLEEEKKIIYIYLQGIVDRRDLHFEENYLPLDYGQDGMIFEEVEGYSIYPSDAWMN